MKPAIVRRTPGLSIVLVFVLACSVGFVYLWGNAGGTVPGLAGPEEYRYSFRSQDVKNLLENGEVRIAGVEVGRVERAEPVDGASAVEFTLSEQLHEGATVRVGIKSLVGSSYIDVVDGDGEPIESGAALPDSAVTEAVDVDELYDMLDAKTRDQLKAAVRSLDASTRGRGESLDATLTGLGRVANHGGTALDALAAQSKDLEALTVETRQLLDTLDTGRGQIARLVSDANTLTDTTADKKKQVEATVRALPGLVNALEPAAADLGRLGRSLAPVARDLRVAAPDLNQALLQLPAVTNDLDALLPDLDKTLDLAPATLTRVRPFTDDVRQLVPQAETTLRDVNPMLAYLAPYGLDLGALFGNFGGSFDTLAEDGIRPIRLTATAEGLATVRNIPVPLQGLLGQLGGPNWVNPYPEPYDADRPKPFRGEYPQVQRED